MTMPRLPFLLLGAISLLSGMLAGLARMGWDLPALDWTDIHGPLMVCGFFGTVIGLERAVALNRPWGFAAPAASAAGGLFLLIGWRFQGAVLLLMGSLLFLAMAVIVARRQAEPFTKLMALGAFCWALGNGMWLAGAMVAEIVALWAAFLVLTIAGERLELARFLPPNQWRNPTLAPPLLLIGIGAVQSVVGAGPAWTAFGAGLVLLVAWSLWNDVVRRTIRQTGLTRYVAVCLLSGYVWLAVAGALMPILDGGVATPVYDAALHALFVGFVFSMVFGHAPIILPAILAVRLPFHSAFYLPLAMLHLSLSLRLAGDLLDLSPSRQWGGLLNAAAIVAFIIVTATRVLTARPKKPDTICPDP
ncbi:hypothetical protein [Magnetospirillum sulfuroxidans]|uniref:Uncharacterized protein n=1 Tax=Magnetospirillum sulfuroxidans TaxID=611300 RepID=A0ABS5IAF0_9PROT|nr:hypothetical protein [Magnetospirillum sulfuroxidans]MBR9971384.1 hypothetical protein [Magnetospirillum sulfuroxidans]